MAEIKDISAGTGSGTNDTVKIADDVVKCIAVLAAADIDGVAGMAGGMKSDLRAMLGGKSLEKGVGLSMEEDSIRLRLSLVVRYGFSIPEISAAVQEKVRSAVENMTGIEVSGVDVNIAGIDTSVPVT